MNESICLCLNVKPRPMLTDEWTPTHPENTKYPNPSYLQTRCTWIKASIVPSTKSASTSNTRLKYRDNFITVDCSTNSGV